MSEIEITPSRESVVGELTVRRALPIPGRRTVGAWCFVDHMGPAAVTRERGLDVGPHPHIGLQTVTWLVSGEALHRDSLGTEQPIAPGQLNLMTAGHGISHAEEATGRYEGALHGVQFWVAQPESTRHGAPAFEHHAELPQVEIGDTSATVLLGRFAGIDSPARIDTEIVGAEFALRGPTVVPLAAGFEHAIVVIDGTAIVEGSPITPGRLAYLGVGRDEVRIGTPERARLLLIGGVPFEAPIVMSWNFVGRSRDELEAAHDSWNADDGRFGSVASRLSRIPAPPPVWRLTQGATR